MRLVPKLWTAATPPRSPKYRRRDPEATLLHKIVREHLETFLARADEEGRPVPAFVEDEFRSYLGCGVLAHGHFVRLYCDRCRTSRLVAQSCGGRGFCPSCGGRRMSEAAAHLVDLVLPEVPVRQYVLTLPFRLRFILAYDHDLKLEVGSVLVRTLFNWYRLRARRRGLTEPECGAVAFVQRFSSNLALNVHFHVLVLDGVFTRRKGELPVFHELPPPTDEDIASLVETVARRVQRLLEERGLADPEAFTAAYAELCEEQPALAAFGAASSQGRQAIGPHRGQPVPRLRGERNDKPRARRKGRLCAEADGFNLHAGVYVPSWARRQLEQLCTYIARPPVSDDRLTLLDDGHIALRLKKPFADGTTHFVYPPLEFLGRLAALVPPPYKNERLYYGVLAGHHAWRRDVVPSCRTPKGPGRTRRGRRLPWDQLIHRVFGADALACECGGTLSAIAEIHDPEVAEAILKALGLPSTPLPIAPARPPPVPTEEELAWAA